MSFQKRIISLFLSFVLIIALLPTNVMAAKNESLIAEDNQQMTITATAKDTITVKEKITEPIPIEPVYKSLSILADDDFTINRDYEQNCSITVSNLDNQVAKQFYLEAENVYPDLSYQFIGNGSADNPIFIAPGESMEITLSVFAQNAERNIYYIPIVAYVLIDGKYVEDSKQSVTLNCKLPMLDLSWKLNSNSETSLSQTYTITNNGDTLTDLAVKVSEKLKDYVSFSPIISNYELEKNENVQFTIYPNLAKMKNENIDKLSGKLIASCAGKISEQTCIFDTKGKEITVTTMGKLGLKQEGNLFTDFKVKNEFSSKYYKGKEYVDISNETKLNDILDTDGFFNYQYKSKLDLGKSKDFGDLNFETIVTSKEFEGNSSDFNNGPTIIVSAGNSPGIIQIKTETVMDYKEYLSLLSSPTTRTLSPYLFSKYRTTESELAKEVIVESVTNLSIDKVTEEFINQITGTDWIKDVYDISKVIVEGETVLIMNSNPKISDTAKVNYTAAYVMKSILSIGSIAVAAVNPIVGGIFSILTAPLDVLLDKYVDAVTDEEYARLSAIYNKYAGKQCTNRGDVTVKFNAPNYSSSSKKPSIYASSRMSGNGYVNKQDTNYNITLNDKPVGKTQNSGLTDVLMTEIPADNLIPGKENTIVFDYDTSPGSHSVATDTEITLMYPNDTEIAYIGEPDDLQDVRIKPDFAIYSENIYANNPIIGEETMLYCNVYNTGSCGGWFTITCTDSETGKIFYKKENHYLAAFSSEKFEFSWIPEKEDTTFLINLKNTSVGLEERDKYATNNNAQYVRDDRNNKAEKTIVARNRQVPTIQSTSVNNIYEHQPFSVIVDVEQCNDILDAYTVFKYENKEIRMESTGSGEYRRYCLYFDEGLPSGDYKIKAEFQYKKSQNTIETVSSIINFNIKQQIWTIPNCYINSDTTLLYGENLEFSVYDIDNLIQTKIAVDSETYKEVKPINSTISEQEYSIDMSSYAAGKHDISVKMYYKGRNGNELIEEEIITINLLSEAESYYTFSISKAIAESSPKFFVYRESYQKIDVIFEPTVNGYKFKRTLDMVNNQSNYKLVISYNSGVIVEDLGANSGVIDQNDCHTLTAIKSDKDKITYAAITCLPGTGTSGSVTIPVSLENPLTLSKGKYQITVSGTVDDVSFYQTIDIDVTTQDQSIDINDFALIYYFDVAKSGSSADKYNVGLYVHNNYGWDSYYLSKVSDNKNNVLKCYSSSDWVLSKVEESNQVYLLIYSDTEVYFIQIKDTIKNVAPMLAELKSDSGIIVLDRSVLNKISLLSNNKNLGVSNVHVNWNEISLFLYGDTIYVPDGEYKLQVNLTDGVQTFLSESTAIINKDCILHVGEDIKATYSNVIITWPNSFGSTAKISCYNKTANWRSVMDITSGGIIEVPNGLCSFNINLPCQDTSVTFTRELVVDENNNIITIGNEFTGNFSTLFADKYQTEDSIQFSIIDVKDSEGNSLSTYDFDYPLSGQVIYKDITEQEKIFTVSVSNCSLYDISSNLPKEPGEYSVSVILTFNPHEEALLYSVTVNDSYAQVSGAGKYSAGEIVSISAGKRNNYDFLGWVSSDVNFKSLSSETTTFIMPAMDVSVTAQWKYNRGDMSSIYIPESTVTPTAMPTITPTVIPTIKPTIKPTATPTTKPTVIPTVIPTTKPTVTPTVIPTTKPTVIPTTRPVSGINKIKKIKAVKKKVVIKKNKKNNINFKIISNNNKKVVKNMVKATIKNKKIAKVVKTKIKLRKVVVTVKGLKKGKTILKLNIGKKAAKAIIKVR